MFCFNYSAFIARVSFLIAFSSVVHAETFIYLQSDELIGTLAGPDLLWDTDDDFSSVLVNGNPVSGFNEDGFASGFINSDNTFGSLGGYFETSGDIITRFNVSGDSNNVDDPDEVIVGNSIIESLTVETTSTFIINDDNTANTNLNIDVSVGPESLAYTSTGDFNWFNNGDDFEALFAGNMDLLDQITFLLPLLPENWETLFIGLDSYQFTGSLLTGQQSLIFYTEGAPVATVPVPAALYLLLSAFLSLGFIKRKR